MKTEVHVETLKGIIAPWGGQEPRSYHVKNEVAAIEAAIKALEASSAPWIDAVTNPPALDADGHSVPYQVAFDDFGVTKQTTAYLVSDLGYDRWCESSSSKVVNRVLFYKPLGPSPEPKGASR